MAHRRHWVVLLLALVPCAANADTARTVISDFGLVGHWAQDCSRDPAADNWHSFWSVLPSGEAKAIYRAAPNNPDNIYTIHSAERLTNDQIMVHQELTRDNTMFETVIIKAQNKHRSQSSRIKDGEYFVMDGKFTSNGAEVYWLTRCGS
jgi:hypothetical protein